MPYKKQAWRFSKNETADATSMEFTVDIQEPVRRIFIDSVGMMDTGHGSFNGYVFIETGGARVLIAVISGASSAVWYGYSSQSWVYAGERLVFQFQPVSVGDVLSVTATGTMELVGMTGQNE